MPADSCNRHGFFLGDSNFQLYQVGVANASFGCDRLEPVEYLPMDAKSNDSGLFFTAFSGCSHVYLPYTILVYHIRMPCPAELLSRYSGEGVRGNRVYSIYSTNQYASVTVLLLPSQ